MAFTSGTYAAIVTGHRSLAMFERYNVKTTREAIKALTVREHVLRAEHA